MKTKHFCLLLLSAMLFGACEGSSKLAAPTGLQGYQSGDKIVLTWSSVNDASSYEVKKQLNGGGSQMWNVYATNHVDYDPYEGVNSYEVRAISQSGQYSAPANVSVYYEKGQAGGGGGGSNPGGSQIAITMSNMAGYWHGKTEAISGGSSYDYSDYYINLSSTGLWERVHITASNKCSVLYGTWSISGSSLYVEVKGQNDFVNGQCTAQYGGNPRTDLYGVESLTNSTMSYTTGQYPYLTTYDFEKVYSIPASYKHNSDL